METKLFTGARRQKVVVEYDDAHGPEWHVMLADGTIEFFDTASAAMKAIRRDGKRGNETVTITTIEWRNVPEGFMPPRS
jgi:hypothetical protein